MKHLLFCGLIFLSLNTFSQDLNARVELLYPKLPTVNKNTFDALEKAIKDFLTNNKWTDDILKPQERIDCSFVITITAWDGASTFTAEAQIQSSRPVYGTAYNSTILNINDKDFNFSYLQGQALDFSEQNYTSNLSSLLAFYAFTIVGMDNDTFSKLGGTTIYNRAQNVLNAAQSASDKGWKATENFRNRYWLSENFSNRDYNPIRESLYTYHRRGLDVMANNPAEGRKAVLSTLSQLQAVDRMKQGNMLSQLFISAKVDELIGILSLADVEDRMKAYSILTQIDPANGFKYDALKK
jgi:hypothetical protein